jgi:hypothetical protein
MWSILLGIASSMFLHPEQKRSPQRHRDHREEKARTVSWRLRVARLPSGFKTPKDAEKKR